MASGREQTDQAHEPVLLREVTGWLRPETGGTFIDCTLGLGGHARALLAASPETRVIGIDRDREALEQSRERLADFAGRFQAIQANFADLSAVLDRLGVEKVRGVVADLGVSSMQLDRGERGFSFLVDAPLDMRMDTESPETAADLVNNLTERELADLIFEYGQERASRRIARFIVRERGRQPITTTKHLADTVVRALNLRGRWRIHPATRTFQALRIAVNGELEAVEALVPAAVSRLESGGRLAIISFHSLEDRIVKRAFQREAGRCDCPAEIRPFSHAPAKELATGGDTQDRDERSDADVLICNRCGARKRVVLLTRKPVRPDEEEVERNPRSRSALLRVCEKI
jgi:16S rRNA (cytosine1402-N4)-methyltransferase